MVFEAHGMSFPCTRTLIIQLCQGKDSFPFYGTFKSVEQYKYLGTVSPNTEVLCKRGQQRLYCLWKLRSFNVDKTLMCMFYRSYIESLLSFSLLCWFNSLNVKNKNCLERIVNQGNKITGRK